MTSPAAHHRSIPCTAPLRGKAITRHRPHHRIGTESRAQSRERRFRRRGITPAGMQQVALFSGRPGALGDAHDDAEHRRLECPVLEHRPALLEERVQAGEWE